MSRFGRRHLCVPFIGTPRNRCAFLILPVHFTTTHATAVSAMDSARPRADKFGMFREDAGAPKSHVGALLVGRFRGMLGHGVSFMVSIRPPCHMEGEGAAALSSSSQPVLGHRWAPPQGPLAVNPEEPRATFILSCEQP